MELYIGDLILNDVISDFCVSFQTIFLYTCGSHSEVKMLREMSNGFAFTLWVKHAPQKFPLASYLHRCHVYFFYVHDELYAQVMSVHWHSLTRAAALSALHHT